jgi:hypothetical protein
MYDWVAWWHWIAANAFSLLVVMYFATTGCVILLALAVYALARRQVRLARTSERQECFLHTLLQDFNAREASSVPQPVPARGAAPLETTELIPAPRESGISAMRHEIEAIRADLAPDSATRPKPSP